MPLLQKYLKFMMRICFASSTIDFMNLDYIRKSKNMGVGDS